jgi:hypothetical protein
LGNSLGSRYGDGGDEKGQTAARTGYVLRFASLCHGHFSSLVGVIARKLTYGNSVAIPAIAKTKNMRRYRKDSWLGDLDYLRHAGTNAAALPW